MITGSGGSASKVAHKIAPVHEEAFAVSELLLSVFQKTRAGPDDDYGFSQFGRCDLCDFE